MKTIPLPGGKIALIDAAEFEFFNQFKWRISSQGYVVTDVKVGRKHYVRSLHCLIMLSPEGVLVDHQSLDKLDCRRLNLRFATRQQNGANVGLSKANTSGFKGVKWHSAAGKWQAAITVNYKTHHLGCFVDKVDAAKAYNAAAVKFFGSFARLNAIPV